VAAYVFQGDFEFSCGYIWGIRHFYPKSGALPFIFFFFDLSDPKWRQILH
jgi:hypothetical protein